MLCPPPGSSHPADCQASAGLLIAYEHVACLHDCAKSDAPKPKEQGGGFLIRCPQNTRHLLNFEPSSLGRGLVIVGSQMELSPWGAAD